MVICWPREGWNKILLAPLQLGHFVFPQGRARFWLCHRQLPEPQCPCPTATSAAVGTPPAHLSEPGGTGADHTTVLRWAVAAAVSSSQSRTPAPSQSLALPSRSRKTAGVRIQDVWTSILAARAAWSQLIA